MAERSDVGECGVGVGEPDCAPDGTWGGTESVTTRSLEGQQCTCSEGIVEVISIQHRTRVAAAALCIVGMAGGVALAVDGSTLGTQAAGANGEGAASVAPRVVEAEVSEVARQLRPLTFKAGQHVNERISDQVDVPAGVTFQFRNLPPGLSYDPATTAIHGTPTTPGTWDVTATAYLAGLPVETATSRVTITGTATAPAPAPGGGGGAPAPAPGGGGAPAPAPAPAPSAPTHAVGIDLAMIDTLPLPPEMKQAAKDALINFDQTMANFWASIPQS